MSRTLLAALVAAGLIGSLALPQPAQAARKAAHSADSNANDPVIATVNGDDIHRSDAEATLQQMVPPGQHISLSDPKVFDKVRNDLISRKLAYQEAMREGVQNSPEVKRNEALLHQQIVTSAFFEKIGTPAVTDEKMRAAYDEAIKTQPKQDELHVRQIEVKTEEEAIDIIKQLDGGADFEKLAKEKSIAKGNAQDGGDIGYISKGTLDPAFTDAAFALQPNTYTKTPVKVGPDYHIIQALDRRPQKLPNFEEAKPQLKSQLMQLAIRNRIIELAKSSKIQAYNIDGSAATAPAAQQPAQSAVAPAQAPTAAQSPTPSTASPLKLPETAPAQ